MLHVKHRPQTFKKVIGNEETIKAINLQLQNVENGLTIMMVGPPGCGKSMIAHIISKEFGASPETTMEVDCAHYTQVDAMREVKDNFLKPSFFSNKKTLILDEFHKLSDSAQSVLLIPSEKLGNSHCIIGCTAYPERVNEMMWQRFLQFKMRPLDARESKELLDRVCESEGLSPNKLIKVMIIKNAEGIPRLLLKGLDIARTTEDINELKYLIDMAKIGEDESTIDLYKSLVSVPEVSWEFVSDKLNELLKVKNAADISAGLLNITAGRMRSGYYNIKKEGAKLSRFARMLRYWSGPPDKATLTIALHNFCIEDVPF